jgi:hypothetical protein
LLAMVLQVDELVTENMLPELVELGDIMVGINTAIDVSLVVAIVIIAWDSVTQVYRLSQKN